MGKHKKRNSRAVPEGHKMTAEKLKAEYDRGYTAGYAQGCKDGGGAPKPPIRYEKARNGKWYVHRVEDGRKNEVKI